MARSTNPFRWFDSSSEVICLVVPMYVKYPLSLRNGEDLLAERGIDICHETVRLWWNRFCPMFAAEIRRKGDDQMRAYTRWRWHLDEVYVRIDGEMRYFWRAVDHESEVLEFFASQTRNKPVALKFMKRLMKRHGRAKVVTSDRIVTSSAESLAKPDARPPWPSGKCSPDSSRPLPSLRPAETSRRLTDSTLTAPPKPLTPIEFRT